MEEWTRCRNSTLVRVVENRERRLTLITVDSIVTPEQRIPAFMGSGFDERSI